MFASATRAKKSLARLFRTRAMWNMNLSLDWSAISGRDCARSSRSHLFLQISAPHWKQEIIRSRRAQFLLKWELDVLKHLCRTCISSQAAHSAHLSNSLRAASHRTTSKLQSNMKAHYKLMMSYHGDDLHQGFIREVDAHKHVIYINSPQLWFSDSYDLHNPPRRQYELERLITAASSPAKLCVLRA